MTIKDFKEQNIAIAFKNCKEVKEFAKMCEPHNMKMSDGLDAKGFFEALEPIFENPLWKAIFGKFKYAYVAWNFMGEGLTWCTSDGDVLDDPHYTEKGWKVVPFEEFKKEGGKKLYFSAKKCIERMKGMLPEDVLENGANAWVRECDGAEYHEGDYMYSPEGMKYRCSRNWCVEEKPEKKLKFEIKISYDGVKKTTATMKVDGEAVKEASARWNPEDNFDFEKGARIAFERLFDNEPKEHEFKIGDRVVCTSAEQYSETIHTIGKHGKVIAERRTDDKAADDYKDFVAVEFDEQIPVYGHSCGNIGKNGHCRWVHKDSLKHE